MSLRFAPEFGKVQRALNEVTAQCAESKSRLERGSNGEVEIRNDWEVDGK